MQKDQSKTPKSWITVGAKLLFGVALASNCCIGALLFINYQSTLNMEKMVAKVLAIREGVDVHLRETIVKLQHEFTSIPRLFDVDPKNAILEQIGREYQVRDRQQLVGREAYASQFSRTEKRDLAKGLFVAHVDNGRLTLSHGLFDAQGAFTQSIEQWRLDGGHPQEDLVRLQEIVTSASNNQNIAPELQQKINTLRKIAADKNLEAEMTRTEILGHVDEINAMEHRMADTNNQQRRFSLFIGMATIIGNVLILFILTRIIVEKPLHRLTAIVNALAKGIYPDIPWRDRRDQIGVLSSAINRFKEVLLELKREEGRKMEEQEVIETLVGAMTASIHHLTQRAGQMAELALSLEDLAGITEQESKNVADLASDTAARTDEVSATSLQISNVVGEINQQLSSQTGEVAHIIDEIVQARQQLMELKQSVTEIDTIAGVVHTITDQTKILALNATIESVKAGEQGRGFAVVANEVKKLSQDTALATHDILEKIETINITCQSFIDCFDSIDQGAAQLHRVTTSISDGVALQKNLIGAIVDLTTRTSENTQQVSVRITEVNKAADGVLRLSVDARCYADEIASLLGDLLQGSVCKLKRLTDQESRIGNPENVKDGHALPEEPCIRTVEQKYQKNLLLTA